MEVELTLLTLSLLFFVSIFTDKIGYKFGVPALLLFLTVGMVFGPDGLGHVMGEDAASVGHFSAHSAMGIGTVALCIILFSGGLDTKLSDILPVVKPGISLSTLGVLLTALVSGVLIWLIFGWVQAVTTVSFGVALLIACTMSSTDSASVFSILRTNGVGLKHQLRPLLELESGANDPMAYILTTTMIDIVTKTAGISALQVVQDIFIQLVVGAALGFLFGKLAVRLLRTVKLANESLYPIMILTACIFIFSATYYMKGNSYLAVYIGGLIIGNSKFTRKRQTKSFFDGLTWLSQLIMFLMLGLMVKPHELLLPEVWLPSLIISIVMIFVSRPLAVFLSLHGFSQYRTRDKLFVSWVGLKGAVPIIFAIMCLASGVPHADLMFDVIFLCTLVSLIVQGTSLNFMAHRLRLAEPLPEKHKLQHFDIDLPEEVENNAIEVEVTEEMLSAGKQLMDIRLENRPLVIMVRRGEDFIVPTGKTLLEVGDQLLTITDQALEEAHERQEEEDDIELRMEAMQLVTNTKAYLKNAWDRLLSSRSGH